jgi:hypothetical protein
MQAPLPGLEESAASLSRGRAPVLVAKNSKILKPSKPPAEPVQALPWRVTPQAVMKASASSPKASRISSCVQTKNLPSSPCCDRPRSEAEWDRRLVCCETSSRIGHFAHKIAQDFLRDGAEELVAGHLPGVDAKPTRASCELPHNIRSKCPAQPNTRGFPLTARLVLTADS